jgi:hypothetical protein
MVAERSAELTLKSCRSMDAERAEASLPVSFIPVATYQDHSGQKQDNY